MQAQLLNGLHEIHQAVVSMVCNGYDEVFLVAHFQTMENYGAHQEPIKQYWKAKGGSSNPQIIDANKILNCPYQGRYEVQNAVAACLKTMQQNDYFISFPVGFEVLSDLPEEE